MGFDFGPVVLRTVTSESFWPVHVGINLEVLVLILCLAVSP
jgi:hypothetical protein